MAQDLIHLRDLRARCVVGVQDSERRAKQDVVINITLDVDLSTAGRSDRIEDTADYAAIAERVVAAVEASSFLLIERLAEHVAQACLADAHVRRVTVTVDKPGALRCARSVAVQITRDRNESPQKSASHE